MMLICKHKTMGDRKCQGCTHEVLHIHHSGCDSSCPAQEELVGPCVEVPKFKEQASCGENSRKSTKPEPDLAVLEARDAEGDWYPLVYIGSGRDGGLIDEYYSDEGYLGCHLRIQYLNREEQSE